MQVICFAPPPPSEEEHREAPWDAASVVKRSQELLREVENITEESKRRTDSFKIRLRMFKKTQLHPEGTHCSKKGQ